MRDTASGFNINLSNLISWYFPDFFLVLLVPGFSGLAIIIHFRTDLCLLTNRLIQAKNISDGIRGAEDVI